MFAGFSRWAFRRLCRFALKKYLKDLLLGEIDLDQLDVQLFRGTAQLTDLALNVDYINEKLAGAAVLVKEGSIGRISIKFLGNQKNCLIEVEELEIVLAPSFGKKGQTTADCCMQSSDGSEQLLGPDSSKLQTETDARSSQSVYLDVHEGVKTIAKFVRWFLTNFNIRLKNLIVAFDPSSDVEEKKSLCYKSLVLRIAEIEYGTSVSEETSMPDTKIDSLLGIARLTNFIRFQGATFEFLQMDKIDNQPVIQLDSSKSFGECHAQNLPGLTTTILTGASDGFSGQISLSIPWKNGSLDIHKIDADISIDPLELQIRQNTIKWIITVWESLKNAGISQTSHVHGETKESSATVSGYCSQSFSLGDAGLTSPNVTSISRTFSESFCLESSQDSIPDALIQHTNLIHDWVPLAVNEEVQAGIELDYSASVDQFFECFDGMRSSQAGLGSSGIWNWTCSVFSAITVASNIASGSVQIPSDHHHVETNVKASIGEVSVIISFMGDEQECSHSSCSCTDHMTVSSGTFQESLSVSDLVNPQTQMSIGDSFMSCHSTRNVNESSVFEYDHANLDIHHLEANFQNVVLNLQIHHKDMKLEASIMHVKVDELYDTRIISRALGFSSNKNNSSGNLPLSEHIQSLVQGVLCPFPLHYGRKEAPVDAKALSQHLSASSQQGLIKVVIFESFAACDCQHTSRFTDLQGKTVSLVSCTVNLPSFVLWVHLQLVNRLLNFFKEVQNSLERSNTSEHLKYDRVDERNGSSLGETTGGSTYITTLSQSANTEVNILLSDSRIVLCFPADYHGGKTISCDKFIALDLSPSSGVGKVSHSRVPEASFSKGNSSTTSTFLHVNIGKLDGYLITSTRENTSDSKQCSQGSPFFSVKIFSMGNRPNDPPSGIDMLWQNGPVTGPWMANRAWSMATSNDQRYTSRATGEGYEFSSARRTEDLEDANSHIRQELILSSSFFLHVHFSQIWIDLDRHHYVLLNDLINTSVDNLQDGTHGIDTNKNLKISSSDSSPAQVSILVECDVLDLCISLDEIIEVNRMIQRELPGSWNCLRLTVKKFELLSVSNVGGINDENFFWLNHSEGQLRGWIIDVSEKPPIGTQDLLLISCSNSCMKRGDGEGANALAFGSAGSSIMYLKNVQSCRAFTSIIVRCGTFVAPGGRMDWIPAICSFFTLPPQESDPVCDNVNESRCASDTVYESSFFVDLADIALSYEPQHKKPSVDGADTNMNHVDAVGLVENSGESYVACLLAAASFNLYNHSTKNSSANEYRCRLQDLGLLICESSGSKGCSDYNVDYFQKAGYVKVASEALVTAVLRIKGVTWEVDCLGSHIKLDTCCDTTDGLARLVAQLQQLYAPDVEDALVHLQSRWNMVQQAHNETIDGADTLHSYSVRSSSERKTSASNVDDRCVGLLDDILENAFNLNGECGNNSTLNSVSCTTGDHCCTNAPHEGSMCRSEMRPQIIDSYYVSELIAPSQFSVSDISHSEEHQYKYDIRGHKSGEYGKGRWYNDGLTIVENHISKIVDDPVGEEQCKEDRVSYVSHDPSETCRSSGRILLKDIDVRWRMYSGFDWSKAHENLVCSLNGRDGNVCLELMLSGLNLQYDVYPEGEIIASSLSVSVEDFHLYDRSKDAPWKMVIGYYYSKNHPRESCAKAFKLDLEAVRPDPLTPLEEYRLHVELLPIRVHLDQSQLNFLIRFFGKDSSAGESPSQPSDLVKSEISGCRRGFGNMTIVEEALLPFFQKCNVGSVIVRVDYVPRRIDLGALRGGNYAELLNLVPWKGIDLHLKHVCAVGVYGWNSICGTVLGEWLEDISHNQVHKLLRGLPPIRSLLAVSSGASKLVSLPVKSYKKDQKLLKGMQRGAIAFVRSISLEAVALGVHLAAGAHEILLQTEYILASTPPSAPSSDKGRRKTPIRSNQPRDAQQGFQQAYESLSDGLGRTASALVGTPLKTYQRGAGAGQTLTTAIRAAPTAAIAPISASARAMHYVLLGVRNSLDPEHKRESMDKYHGPSRS